MKTPACCLLLLFSIGLFSCEKEVEADRLLSSGRPFAGSAVFSGMITSPRVLHRDTLYHMEGVVWVTPGNTLTIEPGVRIECSRQETNPSIPTALIILPGAQLQCNGTAAAPVIFTSGASRPSPGDWGGILLAGKAGGQYGGSSLMKMLAGFNQSADSLLLQSDSAWRYGNTITDNSGAITYTRIEYAGIPGLTSALTLCGTGNSTSINYVEAAWSRSNAFEFRGGTTSTSHLISLCPVQEAFATGMNYQGRLSFSLSLTHTRVADSTFNVSAASKPTYFKNRGDSGVIFDHLTVIGLPSLPPPFYRAKWHNNTSKTSPDSRITHSLFMGYLPGAASTAASDNNISFVKPSALNNYTDNNDSIQLISPWDWADFRPTSGSPANFRKLSSDTTGYIGAFAPDAFPWTGSWARFDYQAVYTSHMR